MKRKELIEKMAITVHNSTAIFQHRWSKTSEDFKHRACSDMDLALSIVEKAIRDKEFRPYEYSVTKEDL